VEYWRTLILVVRIIIEIYAILIVVRAFVAFFVHKQNNLTAFIYRITEPVLRFFRRILPRSKTGFDWAILLALIALTVVIFLLTVLGNSI
jgi:uncharacterized protein YggT (Ycf19 family)